MSPATSTSGGRHRVVVTRAIPRVALDLLDSPWVSSLDRPLTPEELREAVHARLVLDNQQGTLTFSHDKIRECLYAEVSSSRRRRSHGSIGQLLEERYARAKMLGVQQLAELAFHFARSPDLAKGIQYSHRAAVQALQTFAAEEAMSHYQTALDLLGS